MRLRRAKKIMLASHRLRRALPGGLLWPALALPLAGCLSDDPNVWYNKTVMENLFDRPQQPAPPPPAAVSAALPLVVDSPGAPPVATAPAPVGPPAANAYPAVSASAAAASALPESELYRSEASCGGMMLGSGAPPSAAASQSVGLAMSECEVVRRMGPPDRVELAATPRGERILTLSYVRGPYPRLYRFMAGRLYSIEVAPPPAAAPAQRRHTPTRG